MQFDVLNRFSDEVQFTAEIECDEGASNAVKLGLAVKWAVKTGADLDGADLDGADLDGANLYEADLNGASLNGTSLNGAILDGASLVGTSSDGANLDRASFDGASGINDYVKCMQIDRYPITYTFDTMQIGCQSHSILEWMDFDDNRILQMDGKSALNFWRKWKDWIFQTIEMCPAKPTNQKSEGA